MRKAFVIVLAAAVTIMIAGVVVFHYSLELGWTESIYFVITTITTVGYGDINLHGAPATVKLFGNFLMFSGAASLAALFGIITDIILQTRLREYFGIRRRRMRDHIVLCGLGNVGYRVLEQLHQLGEKVLVIEKDENCRFTDSARQLASVLIIGDMRLSTTLERAHIKEARCLIAVSDEDLANLEAALNARAVNPDIRVVMRLFDQNLADKVKSGFGVQTAISTSAVAAPAFAMAAMDPSVIGSFYVGRELMLNIEITIAPKSPLEGLTIQELAKSGQASILAHESQAKGIRRLHPADPIDLEPGDKLVISTSPDYARRIHELNTPKATKSNR